MPGVAANFKMFGHLLLDMCGESVRDEETAADSWLLLVTTALMRLAYEAQAGFIAIMNVCRARPQEGPLPLLEQEERLFITVNEYSL